MRANDLTARSRVDLIAKAVDIARQEGVPSGIGAHDLRFVDEWEKNDIMSVGV